MASQLREASEDTPQRRQLLLRILVLATYVKRRKDMTISADRSSVLLVSRLSSALRESCSNLSLSGISGNFYLPKTEAVLPIGMAFAAYDLFEDALELALDTLTYFLVTVTEEGKALTLRVNLECAADLSPLAQRWPGVTLEQDEDTWFLTKTLAGGEDA